MRCGRSCGALLLVTLALPGCGESTASDDQNSPSPHEPTDREGEPDDEDPGAAEQGLNIPQEWITRTSEAWPASQGFRQHAPVQEFTDECLLFDQEPEFFDEVTQFRFSGFGSYGRPTTNFGNEPSTEDSYRYLCSLARAEGQPSEEGLAWTPAAQLMVTDSLEHAEETVAAFLDQADLPERVHKIQTIQAHGAEIHTVEREFPTNPGNGGELEAVFYDEEAGAIMKLRIHSMDEDLRAEHGGQGIAEDLARLLLGSR